jgi:predicted ATPase
MQDHSFFEATTLVGRERELARLRSLEEKSRAGGLQVALIAGEPGIGKTRLLREIARCARQQGTTVLQGGASGTEGMPPYLPFLEALGQHIRSVSADELRSQAGAMASVLATILPELSLRLGGSASSYPLPPEQARLRLFEAVGLFLNAIATPRPLLLVLDDLHWSDQASLDLLCHLAQHQPTARLLIVGAYREGEIMHRSAFERALAKLERLRLLTTIFLAPLTAEAVAELAAGDLGAAVDPAVSSLLASQSEGNPFLAEELLRDWLESGAGFTADPEPAPARGSTPSLSPVSLASNGSKRRPAGPWAISWFAPIRWSAACRYWSRLSHWRSPSARRWRSRNAVLA